MKDQLENSIKKSLEGFEAPYNPAAWDTMRAKLDATRPTTTAKPTGKTGWWIAASIVVVGISVISYNAFRSEETTQTAQETVEQNTEQQLTNENVNSNSTVQSTTTTVDASENQTPSVENNASANSTPSMNTNHIEFVSNQVNGGNQEVNTNVHNEAESANSTSSNTNHASNAPIAFPAINNVCQNDVITIDNTNNERMIVSGPDLHFIIPANESRKIRVKSAGNHKMMVNSSEAEFNVNEAPQADFNFDQLTKFENGLPTTIVETSSLGVSHEWVINGNKYTGTSAKGHFYTKGTHDVTLVVENSYGCKTSVTKPVYVEESYNLMAMNSFRPHSLDPTTNTFMPYALKERDVNFTLIIIDPKDGQVIYETSNATEGWNGIDRRTGQLVPMEKIYIWKVTIEKLAPGENQNEYSGQVIPVNSSNH